MNRAEAGVTAQTLSVGGIGPGRAQVPEETVADEERFGLGSVYGEISTGQLQRRGHCVARLVQGVSFLG